MNIILKLLVAAACVVVISAGGYWLWSQNAQHQEAEASANFNGMRGYCLGKIRDLNMGAYKSRPEVDACIAKGYLTLADQQAAESIIGGLGQ